MILTINEQYIGNFAEVKVLRNDDGRPSYQAQKLMLLVLSPARLASRCRTDGRTYPRFWVGKKPGFAWDTKPLQLFMES